jgi:hypothetical protein
VHDKGYKMTVPTNASTVVVVIAHHARRGQVSHSVSWKKNRLERALDTPQAEEGRGCELAFEIL